MNWSTPLNASLTATVLVAVSCAQVSSDRMETVSEALICMCGGKSQGCGQLLSECNMVACPSSGPMRHELETQLAEKRSDEEILAAFSDKYGPRVRSVPPFSNWFNASAWLTPFGAMVGGGYLLTMFMRRSLKAVPAMGLAMTERYAKEIEEELREHRLEE